MATGLNTSPTDVYLSFVESLFGNRKTLFIGMFVHVFTYVVVFVSTYDVVFLGLIGAYIFMAIVRTYWCTEFDKVNHATLTHEDIAIWENRYLQGAFVTAIILGVASGYSVLAIHDNFAEIACISVTMGTMVSVVGRNFGSARVTKLLTLGACLPIMAGFLLSGSIHMALLALLFVPFILTTSMMAKGVRDFLYQNVMASREIAHIAGRFNIALNTMTHGLFMLDSTNQIQVANHKAFELFHLDDTLIVKDQPIQDIVRLGLKQAGMDSRAQDDVIATLQELIDGRQVRAQIDISRDLCMEFTVSRRAEGDVVLIFEDVTGRVRAERKLIHIAHYDSLTGLPNRGHFAELVSKAVASQAPGMTAGFMVLDIDEFKQVNDKKGHVFGDRLLVSVSDAIQRVAPDNVICARMMGDEFLLYFKAEDNVADLETHMRNFHAGLRGNYEVDGQIFHLAFSAGYVLADSTDDRIEDLQFKADLALAETKTRQRGGCTGFAAEMDARYLERLQLKDDLRLAIASGDLTVLYQPMFRPDGLMIMCCEALCRWNHPAKGPIGPNVFIQMAEEMGIVSDITRLIIEKACRDCMTWPSHMSVSVNLSVQDLQDDAILGVVNSALKMSGLDPHRLHLEVTESSFMDEPVAASRILESFRSLGITIAIDDFGTGYSSLSYLDGLPLDIVKIDRSFVRDICENERRFKLLKGAVNLSRDLGLKIVIEGVETNEQLELLRENHCGDLIQGYVFSRPVPNSAIATLSEALTPRASVASALTA